jgi:thiamine pyrophosphate-dependent acetolactate synthase large subunit-like protein
MAHTVADILVEALQKIGVRHIFGLIGDSLNPLADAVRRSDIEWIGVRHEEGAALAAAGQAKLTGRLGVCCGTTGPGSTHLVAGLYEASRDHAPVLALSGDMPRQLHGTDHIQTTATDLLFRDVSLYTETVTSAAQAPAVIHQAIAAAYAGRSVAHLTLPQDVIEAKAPSNVASLSTLKPRPELAASAAEIAELARRIDAAGNVVIMCGAGCHDAAEELRALSDRLKAPLIHSVKGQDILPYDDPRWIGGIGMIGTKAVYNAVMSCDLLLMLGTDYPYSEFLPQKGDVVRRSRARARTARADCAWCRRLGAADAATIVGQGRGQDRRKILRSHYRGTAEMGRQARQTGGPGAQQGQDSPAGGCARRQRSRQAGRDFRVRYRAEYAVVGQLDPAKRGAAYHRLIQ